MRTIVLTGGGTAGHVLPNIALLPYLRQSFDKIYYLGGNGVEKEIAQQNGLDYYEITTVKLRRTLTLKNLLIPFKLIKGIRQAKKILRQLKPDVIFSKGGFVALPVVYAASALKIKIIAHESDMSLGLANRLTAKKCALICSTFPLNKKLPHLVQTGAIIRERVYHGNPARIALPVNGKPNLLIVGGSLGAVVINQTVTKVLDELCRRFNVLHVTGKGKINPQLHHPNYLQVEYLNNLEDAYAWAEIVVARAGSGTVSELLALHKPVVYIPLSKAESRGDQIQNAQFMQELGVCSVIQQEDLTPANLLTALENLYQRKEQIIANCVRQTWIDGTQKVISCLQQS